jgi:hypothetical protein
VAFCGEIQRREQHRPAKNVNGDRLSLPYRMGVNLLSATRFATPAALPAPDASVLQRGSRAPTGEARIGGPARNRVALVVHARIADPDRMSGWVGVQ